MNPSNANPSSTMQLFSEVSPLAWTLGQMQSTQSRKGIPIVNQLNQHVEVKLCENARPLRVPFQPSNFDKDDTKTKKREEGERKRDYRISLGRREEGHARLLLSRAMSRVRHIHTRGRTHSHKGHAQECALHTPAVTLEVGHSSLSSHWGRSNPLTVYLLRCT